MVGILGGALIGFLSQDAVAKILGLPTDSGPVKFLRDLIAASKIFGDLFLAALRMIVVPLVLFSVASGVGNLEGGHEVGRKMARTLTYFLATSLIAVLLGIVLTNIIQPGGGMTSEALIQALPTEAMEAARASQTGIASKAPTTLIQFLRIQIDNIFMNPFKALADMNLIGVVFFSMLLGMMLLFSGEQGRPAREFFNSMNVAVMKMVQIVIWLAPPGLFALAANLIAAMGPEIVNPLAKYFVTVSLGLTIQLLIVYPIILWTLARYNPLKFFLRFKEAMLFAISTSSSSATLPVSMRVVQEQVGADQKSASFVLPMGATINMDGTALYEAVAAMFVAQLIGIPLDLKAQFLCFFTATLAAIGTAGIPQAGLVTMVIVFNALGIPLELMAIVIVVDRPLDHLRTMVNVTGDSVGAVIISSYEGALRRQ